MIERATETVEATGISKATPVAVGGGVSACSFFGYQLPDMIQILTIIYLIFSILKLAWDTWRNWKKEHDDN